MDFEILEFDSVEIVVIDFDSAVQILLRFENFALDFVVESSFEFALESVDSVEIEFVAVDWDFELSFEVDLDFAIAKFVEDSEIVEFDSIDSEIVPRRREFVEKLAAEELSDSSVLEEFLAAGIASVADLSAARAEVACFDTPDSRMSAAESV